MKTVKLLICAIIIFAIVLQASCSASTGNVSSKESSAVSEETGESRAADSTEESEESEESNESEESSVQTIGLTNKDIKDKIRGSWAAQMIGVAWGASTEFQYQGTVIPEDKVPEWNPQMINTAYAQDDLYVEIPYLDTLYNEGHNCDLSLLAAAFRTSTFGLDHANLQGRANLRAGIPAPLSGSYLYSYHCDDIDWQIEADFLGNLYPGLVDKAAERAFEIGHITNYGDGVYGGVYVAVMHAAAFTAESVYEIAEAGRLAIPEGTKFRAVLDEVNDCYNDGLTWQECWQKIQDDWAHTARCVRWLGLAANIDAKLNAAYIHMGLLWGNGDFAETIKISMRCGQDSDCNPSSAAGVLGTFYGFSGLPSQYTSSLDSNTVFSGTDYSFGACVRVSCSIVERVFEENGVKYVGGEWLVPVQNMETYSETGLVPYEQWPSDVVCAYLYVSSGMRGKIRLETAFALPEGYEGEVVETLDMGDGTVPGPATDTYKYSEDGTYEIRYTVKAGDKESTAVAVVTVKGAGVAERGFSVTPSCSTKSPAGGGNKDINVIVDENCPNPSYGTIGEQYDTYTGSHSGSEWFALEFDRTVLVTDVVFTEGMHFDNGGWFSSAPKVQVLKDGKWTDAETECDIPYGGHDSFTTFTFSLVSPEWCEGVRVTGKPGGSAVFASCAELDVMFDGVKDAD
ncbi:MAG: ADP-ribosylglycohydrolase family protein [Clostridia bacterium]|nr:ADP-ribosylglycohydrolase family protein [Clostridia bacterium]